jgi:muramoyltetrapeptide carboxypeptidase
MLIPPPLRPGDTVGLLAPASPFPYDELRRGLHVLRHDWGLTVIEAPSLTTNDGPFAGTVAARTAEFQALLNDPAVRAILPARGGYGTYQLIDRINFTKFLDHPKWIVGFSDITLVLNHVQRLGVASLHGMMPRQYGQDGTETSLESLRRWLFGQSPVPYQSPAHALNRPGTAIGPLIGGNLVVLLNTIATASEPIWAGALLVLEDIGESYFSVDRLLMQLRRSGRLAQVAGVLVGQFSDMRQNESLPYNRPVQTLIADHLHDLGVPVCFDFPVGHVPQNLALPIGLPASLRVDESGGTLTF